MIWKALADVHRNLKSNWCIRMLFSQALHSSIGWQFWSPDVFDMVMDKRQVIGLYRGLFRCRSAVVKWDCKVLGMRITGRELKTERRYVVGNKYFRSSFKRGTADSEGWRNSCVKDEKTQGTCLVELMRARSANTDSKNFLPNWISVNQVSSLQNWTSRQ